jgi:arylsulfatase A-like enzyme
MKPPPLCRILVSFVASVLLAPVLFAAAPAERPNVIVILADDLGYGDLGCYGSPNIETPNLDRMAAEGMRFTSFYAAPVCAPSRAQLMTGCYPTRVGLARNPFPSSEFGLHPNETTIAELLRGAGYATMCIGKWHLGDAPELLPTRQGFDAYFGVPFSNDMWRFHPKMPPRENEEPLMKQMRERAAYTGFHLSGSYYPPGMLENDLPLMRDENVIEKNPDQTQFTTRYTEAALEFIERQRDKPFFLYLAQHMPHVPLFVSDKFAGKSPRGLYGDVVMELDWSVGQILEKLKRLSLDERTLVIFMSDNGPWLHYGIDGGSAGSLRDGKTTSWEGGVRVPAIARWPGRIPAGRRSDAIAGNLDLLPTLAGLSGAKVSTERIIDGRDLWPLLSGKTEESPHQYFHYLGGSPEKQINYRGIRDAKWKLVLAVDNEGKVEPRELYDLDSDPGERFDRLKQHPDIAQRLASAAQEFYTALRANMRPAGKRVAGNAAPRESKAPSQSVGSSPTL